MNTQTLLAIKALLSTDPSVTAEERARILNFNHHVEPDRVVRLDECARRLGISRRSVTNLLADGSLPSVRLPGRTRALGTRESAIVALLENRQAIA